MGRPNRWMVLLTLAIAASLGLWARAQEPDQGKSVIRVEVNLIQLNVAVTDRKGNYVTGLKPADFVISEDGIPQQAASFEEGNGAPQSLLPGTQGEQSTQLAPNDPPSDPSGSGAGTSPSAGVINRVGGSLVAGSNVFILFDTSNYMYRGRGFVFAQDAIADFVRSLDSPYRVAFYSYSRDFYRASALTPDRSQVLRAARATVNGDESALYNALLMTLKDAAQYSGRKVVVVFSNGPDNSSMVPPEDVDELAQSEGIPIYMISTREAKLDPSTSAVFGRLSATTGGSAYYAKSWQDERQAFSSIREDLQHLYYLSYYPQANPNRGWRAISVRLKDKKYSKYTIRTRSGYRPIPAHVTVDLGDVPAS